MKTQAKTHNSIMVCVTNQRSCDTLMDRGRELVSAGGKGAKLHMVHCVESGRKFMNSVFEADAIEYLFTAAQLYEAELTLLRSDDVEDALVDYAKTNGVDLIVIGTGSATASPRDHMGIRLQRRLPEITFDIVPTR